MEKPNQHGKGCYQLYAALASPFNQRWRSVSLPKQVFSLIVETVFFDVFRPGFYMRFEVCLPVPLKLEDHKPNDKCHFRAGGSCYFCAGGWDGSISISSQPDQIVRTNLLTSCKFFQTMAFHSKMCENFERHCRRNQDPGVDKLTATPVMLWTRTKYIIDSPSKNGRWNCCLNVLQGVLLDVKFQAFASSQFGRPEGNQVQDSWQRSTGIRYAPIFHGVVAWVQNWTSEIAPEIHLACKQNGLRSWKKHLNLWILGLILLKV